MTDTLSIDVQSYGEHALTEEDMCIAVGEDLTRHYPGYDWMVGANHDAGTIVIDLMVDKPPHLQNHAFLLHMASLVGPGGHERVMRAGGEMLERFGLPRSRAPEGWRKHAVENGLDTAGEIRKSRNGG